MATQVRFGNKIKKIPGAYSQIKSGIKNPSLALEFGNTLIINTGSERFFTGGAGINGTLKSGIEAHTTVDNIRDFRNFVGGGLWWLLASPLFLPGGGATAGISSLTYIDAATTIPAEIALVFGGQDASDGDGNSANNGSITIQSRAEGFAGNGVLGDETRAKATLTVSNAGVAGNVITAKVDGLAIGSYTVETGDNIAAVVSSLADAIDAYGLAEVFSHNSTQIVIYAPRGYAASLNGTPATIVATGSVAGSSGNFSGGIEGTFLTRGYAAQIVRGEIDEDKYKVRLFRGTFKGIDSAISNGTSYDGIAEAATTAELLVESPEVSTVQELVTWMEDESGEGFAFNQFFKIKTSSIGTTDIIVDADLVEDTDFVKAEGGSSSFSISDLNDALDSVEDLNFDFILTDNWGDDARSVNNLAIQDFVVNTANIKPDVYVAAGSTEGEWSDSLAVVRAYDSQYVTVVHGGAKKLDLGNRSFKSYDSIYKAAALLGREAGIEPQNPLTFKNIGIEGEVDMLNNKRIVAGLDAGLLMTRLDNGSFEIVKGINSLQNNTYLVNPDGSTHSKQFARIERQLNKTIVINAKTILLKKENGANRNTVSVEDVTEFAKGLLQQQVATDLVDNLLISFRAVEVIRTQDAYDITYAFEPNSEISFLIFTGVAVDPSK